MTKHIIGWIVAVAMGLLYVWLIITIIVAYMGVDSQGIADALVPVSDMPDVTIGGEPEATIGGQPEVNR